MLAEKSLNIYKGLKENAMNGDSCIHSTANANAPTIYLLGAGLRFALDMPLAGLSRISEMGKEREPPPLNVLPCVCVCVLHFCPPLMYKNVASLFFYFIIKNKNYSYTRELI